MSFDGMMDWAVSVVAVAPSPPTSGLSLSITTGDGAARFPFAAGVPFTAQCYPNNALPTPSNAEVMWCTISGDNVTILSRNINGRNTRSIGIGDIFELTSFAKSYTDIQNALPTQTFEGLSWGTHVDADKAANQVMVRALREARMNDGWRYSGITMPMTADISTSGKNGLDTGARGGPAWYSLHLIGKSTTKANSDLALLIHRELTNTVDQSQTVNSGQVGLNNTSGHQLYGIPFTCGTTGPLPAVDIAVEGNGTPTGNVRLQIQTDNSGVPSGTVLATSDALDMSPINTSSPAVTKFIFRTPPTLTATTKYWIVAVPSYATNASNFVGLGGQSSGSIGYAYNGSTWSLIGTWSFYFKTYVSVTFNSGNLAFPTGYDQSCRLGYFLNNGGNVLTPFIGLNRRSMFGGAASGSNTSIFGSGVTATIPTLVDLSNFIPPVPCNVLISASNSVLYAQCLAFSTPYGYQGYGQYPGIAQRVFDADNGVASVGPINLEVLTEMQSIYIAVSSGGGDFWRAGYEW